MGDFSVGILPEPLFEHRFVCLGNRILLGAEALSQGSGSSDPLASAIRMGNATKGSAFRWGSQLAADGLRD